MKIDFVEHKNIDKQKWDKCVKNSDKRSIYGYSWFLDIIAEKWNALILNDYEAVLPLPFNRKYLIPYIFTPTHLQKVAIFSPEKNSKELLKPFLDKIPKKYAIYDLRFDETEIEYKNAQIEMMKNYVLDLNKPYDELYKNYRTNTRRNVKKSKQLVQIKKETDFSLFYNTRRKIILERLKGKVTEYDFIKYYKLFDFLKKTNRLEIYNAYDNENNFCASSCFFNEDEIVVAAHIINEKGWKINANYALIDYFIQKNAETELKLDFAGSNVKGIEYFNSGFGSRLENYSRIYKHNWNFIKLFKK